MNFRKKNTPLVAKYESVPWALHDGSGALLQVYEPEKADLVAPPHAGVSLKSTEGEAAHEYHICGCKSALCTTTKFNTEYSRVRAECKLKLQSPLSAGHWAQANKSNTGSHDFPKLRKY